MNSQSQLKKIERKLNKLQHVVFKETGITCGPHPSKHLAILNAGLVNGLTDEIIYKHFSKYGEIEHIILIPGKSCSFLSYVKEISASRALQNYNSKLNIAQDNKPIYISYANKLPDIQKEDCWDKYPPGLILLDNFITEEEEKTLLETYTFQEDLTIENMKHRQVKHYGYEFKYDINNVDKGNPLDKCVPVQLNFLWHRLEEKTGLRFCPDQLTLNKYNAGQGIPHHIDTHSAFEDPIVSLSLQSPIIMEFKKDKEHLYVILPSRSLAILSGECRYEWTHGITPRKFDIIHSKNGYTSLERGTRISFTFRKILQGECNCDYKIFCDSYQRLNKPQIENIVALELEKLHVHQVYENIATHFSDTRHKPWPNVLNFVQSFAIGSILIDIGCGNGKYLGQNKNIFDVGCDQSISLITVCKERDFEAFTGNCLNVPIKNNIADGVISIAVIHHLANEERRLSSIKEIIRILKIGGSALIYVWAKDQQKNKQKTSYIKQDRKNRRQRLESAESTNQINKKVSVAKGVSLPIHTNRTQFKHCDLLVPWKLKSENESTFLRFYHVFEENELEDVCRKLTNIEIVQSYYDQGNWCVVIKKIKE